MRSNLQAVPGRELAPQDMKQARVLLDYAEGTLESTSIMKQLLLSRTETLTLTTGITWKFAVHHSGASVA